MENDEFSKVKLPAIEQLKLGLELCARG